MSTGSDNRRTTSCCVYWQFARWTTTWTCGAPRAACKPVTQTSPNMIARRANRHGRASFHVLSGRLASDARIDVTTVVLVVMPERWSVAVRMPMASGR
jgi:hypothetical protein